MRYSIEFRPLAGRQFKKLSKSVQEIIKPYIDALAEDPRPVGCRALTGAHGAYRIRVGDYRVVYEVKDEVLVVLVIRLGHRREIYR